MLTLPLDEYRRLLGTYLRPLRGRVALLAALLIGGVALQLVNPQIIRYFVDATQSRADAAPLVYAGLAFIAVSLGGRLLAIATAFLSVDLGWRATNSLRAALAEHLLRLDMPFHKTHTPGELIERVDGDANELADFFTQLVIRAVTSALLILGVLVLLFIENWLAGLALALYSAISIAALAALQGIGVRRWTAARQAQAEQYGYIEERISGVEDIQGNGAAPYALRRLFSFAGRVVKTRRSAEMVEYFSSGIGRLLFGIGWALGLGTGAYLYSQGQITIGTVFLIVAYITLLAGPLEGVRKQASNLQRSTAGITRISELFRKAPAVRARRRELLPPGALAVHFDGVSFAYADEQQATVAQHGDTETPRDQDGIHRGGAEDAERGGRAGDGERRATSYELRATSYELPATDNRQPATGNSVLSTQHSALEAEAGLVLRDVSFSLDAGRVLGVLGRTGSGKTTITRLLFRLYDPGGGAVRLGDVDIRDVTLDDLRARVGMVTQDVQLFSASLRDNITFFDPSIDDARINAALDELGLRDWLGAMPRGLDTRLAAGGAGMSAGEAQLLAFTRLLLKDPGLIILDEAASRLDPITERRLERAITRLLRPEGGRRSGIIIAHRLRTVQRADDILILEGGRVVEYGPRAELAADPGSRFYSLLQTGVEEALA